MAFLAIARLGEWVFRKTYVRPAPAWGGVSRHGWTNVDIAELAGVSDKTIRRYRESAFAALTADAVDALADREAGYAETQRQAEQERRRREAEERARWLRLAAATDGPARSRRVGYATVPLNLPYGADTITGAEHQCER
jgi:hypothetical protein